MIDKLMYTELVYEVWTATMAVKYSKKFIELYSIFCNGSFLAIQEAYTFIL